MQNMYVTGERRSPTQVLAALAALMTSDRRKHGEKQAGTTSSLVTFSQLLHGRIPPVYSSTIIIGSVLFQTENLMFDKVPVRLYVPSNRIFNGRAVLFIHGGGWVHGSVGMSDLAIIILCNELFYLIFCTFTHSLILISQIVKYVHVPDVRTYSPP